MAAVPENQAKQDVARLWESWSLAHPYPYGDAWHPFVVSLRIWALLDVFDGLVRGGSAEALVKDHLAVAGGYLRHNLEVHLQGNHLLKNLKALVGLAYAQDNREATLDAVHRFTVKADHQILPDGGHVERSPSYHAHVLADLLDVRDLAGALSIDTPRLDAITTRAQDWAAVMRHPGGSTPALNDSSRLDPAALDQMGVGRKRPSAEPQEWILPSSGYAVLVCAPLSIVAEVGGPGPTEYPGHAHAGTLGFELAIDDDVVLCDTGVTEYSGTRRSYERSTDAHNTVTIDGKNSSAVWGDFRAAHLARSSVVHSHKSESEVEVSARAELGGRLKPIVHERIWRLSRERLLIEDRILGTGVHELALHLHSVPGVIPVATPDGTRIGPLVVRFEAPEGLEPEVRGPDREHGVCGPSGLLEEAAVTILRGKTTLPCTIRTTLDLGRCQGL